MKVMEDLLVKMLAGITIISVSFLGGATDCPYVSHLSISTPRNMEALSGSCLQIPCDFKPYNEEAFYRTGQIFGAWMKSFPVFGSISQNVIFNSSGTIRTYPMNIIGNLSQKQCTTVFSDMTSTYTDTYYFRIDGPSYMATAGCDPLQITVIDSPPAPSLVIPRDLKEKETIIITCSAFTPCPHSPPKLTWTLKDASKNRQINTNGTFSTQIQESITLTEKHDGYNITCSATYPVNEGKDPKTAKETKTLSVSYAPKSTSASISPSDEVPAGVYVNLTCSSRAKPPVSSFTWFKLSSGKPMNVSEGEVYSFNATVGGVYYCEAKNAIGKETSPQIQLYIEGEKSFSLWWAVIGGLLGITGLICLVILIWWGKSKHTSFQETQGLRAGGQTEGGGPSRAEREVIH